jgi:hypothetical protein
LVPALTLGLLIAANVSAQEPASASRNATIVVTFDPRSIEQGTAVSAVKAHMSGLPVQVLLEPVQPARTLGQRLTTSASLALSREALGTFSIEIGPDRELLIFFTEPDGSATLIRRLPPSREGVRVAVEQAAIVVRSLVEALLEGRRIGMTPDAEAPPARAQPTTPEKSEKSERPQLTQSTAQAAPEAAKPEAEPLGVSIEVQETPEPEAPARPKRRFAISGGYTGTDFAPNVEWESGFTLGARWLARQTLYAGLRYTFFPRIEGGADAARVSVARHPIEIVAGYVGTAVLAPNAELGVVADYSRRETLHTAPEYQATPAATRWTFALGLRAGVTWSASSAVQLSLRGGVDFLLTRYSYAVPAERPAILPRNVRRRLELEVALAPW